MPRSAFSMRLRPRYHSGSGVTMNDAASNTTKVAATGRTVFGDVSNRRTIEPTKDDTEQGLKPTKKAITTSKSKCATNTGTNTASTGTRMKDPKPKHKVANPELKRRLAKERDQQLFYQKGHKRPNDKDNVETNKRVSKRLRSSTMTGLASNLPVSENPHAEVQSFQHEITKKTPSRNHDKPRNCASAIVCDEHVAVPLDFRLARDFYSKQNYTYGIAHFDLAGQSNPLLCKEYVTDIYQHLYHAEAHTRPKTYMEDQDDINAKMRAILVDWLVEVHMKFRLVPETLFLCVNIIDRYCGKIKVKRSKLQLIGVTALLIACKHEEIYPPEVRDCVYITDRAYDRQEVLDMEQSILRKLDWKISVPTAYPFLHRFLSLVDASPLTRYAASYYLERTLQEHDLLEFRPSLVCAAAVILALNNPDIRVHEEDHQRVMPGLPKILMEYTEFDGDELTHVASLVANKVSEEPITASRRQLIAVKRKYENRRYHAVSKEVELPSVLHVIETSQDDRPE